ncbi:MAG: hypothetical protein OHK0044_14480 [Burkholderiaceae bacterium]
MIIGPTSDAEPAVPLPRWIIRGFACAALLAALMPAWSSVIHLASGAWRTDLCDGGGPRAAHVGHHDCCLGSADSPMRAAAPALRQDVPAPASQAAGRTAGALDRRFTRAVTRAPPGRR